MSSLAACLKKAKNLSAEDRTLVGDIYAEYKGQENAASRAVSEAIDAIETERTELVARIEKRGGVVEAIPAKVEVIPEKRADLQKRAEKQAKIDETKDTLLTAIAKLGGISREAAEKEGEFDSGDFRKRGSFFGKNTVFRKGGRDLDDMAQALSEYGYPTTEDGNYTVNALLGSLKTALGGKDVYSSRVSGEIAAVDPFAGMEDVAEELDLLSDQYEQPAADWADLRLQAEAALGEEAVESIVERAAIQNQTDAGFRNQVTDELERAINEKAKLDVAGRRSIEEGEKSGEGEILEQHTEEDLAERADASKRSKQKEVAAEQKAEADRQREEYLLTGSVREIDELAARGQGDLLAGKPEPTKRKPEPISAGKSLGDQKAEEGEYKLEKYEGTQIGYKGPLEKGRQTRKIRGWEVTEPDGTERIFNTKREAQAWIAEQKTPVAKYSFAGQQARSADKSALGRAVQMEQAGESAEKIRKETGWFLGMEVPAGETDQKKKMPFWRFEIPDKDMRLKKDPKSQPGKPGVPPHWLLGDLVDHPKLFEAYPELKDIKVETMEGTDVGNYNPTTNTIRASIAGRRSVLIHEITHVIQGIEKFARGGNTKLFEKSEFAKTVADIRQTNAVALDLFEQAQKAYVDRDTDAAMRFLDTATRVVNFEAYRRLAGEIEARDVQARQDMTPLERSFTPPYDTQGIPQKDAIVLFRDEKAESATIGQSPDQFRANLGKKIGKAKLKRMERTGLVEIRESVEDFPSWLKKGISAQSTGGRRIRGLWDGKTAWLVSSNIPKGTELGVLAHEVGEHAALEKMTGPRYQNLIDRFDELVKANDPSALRAVDRVPGTTISGNIASERLAYLIEDVTNANEEQKRQFSTKVRALVREAIAEIRAWFYQTEFAKAMEKQGIKLELTDQDIAALARAAVDFAIQEAGGKGVKFPQAGGTKPSDTRFSKADPFEGYGDLTPEQERVIKKGKFGARHKKTVKEWKNEITDRAWLRFRQGTVDQFASIKGVMGDTESWMKAHLTAGSMGALETAVDYGIPHLQDGVIQVDTTEKSLKETLEPLGDELNRFLAWVAGNRAERLSQEDRERLFEGQDIKTLKGLNSGKMKDGKSRSEVFKQVRQDFEKIGNGINKIAVDTGLLSQEEADVWSEQGFYVPFYRMVEGETRGPGVFADGLTKQTFSKKLKGADIPLDDLLGNTLANWAHVLSASMKNQAAVGALRKAESLRLATQVPKATASKTAVWVRENGEQVWYELDTTKDAQLVRDALLALNWQGMNNMVMRGMRKFKRALTIGVTVSPEFRIANLLRDSIHSIAVAPMSKNIPKNVRKGWMATKKGSDVYAQMLASGALFGDSGYIHGADPDAVRMVVDRGVDRATILTPKKLTKFWDMYQDFGARMENINRAALFQETIAPQAEGGRGGDLLTAAFEARDLLDFSRTGSWEAVRFLAQSIPFLNARLQGLDKLGRSAMTPGKRKQFGVVVGMYAMASLALYLAMKDDDEYKEAPQWERDAYHLFKIPGTDTMFRLPRPFEVGAIGTLWERAWEQILDDEVHGDLFLERLQHAFTETFAFSAVPQAAQPLIELWGNRDAFTGRAIETLGMQKLSPERRKRVWTSETAIASSEALNKIPWERVQLSPVQVEHLVNGYFGWAGAQVLALTDFLVSRPARGAAVRPAKEWDEWVVTKRFFRTGVPRSTQYSETFYDRLNEAGKAFSDIRDAKEEGDLEEAAELRAENITKLRTRKWLGRQQRTISKINKRMERINGRKDLDADSKRAILDIMLARKNRLLRVAVERTEGAFE